MASIWQITREYAGIAEAGGVKNVVCSLSEGLVKAGHDVTVFMPLYGCTALGSITNFDIDTTIPPLTIQVKEKQYTVTFANGIYNGVYVIFVINSIFTNKMGVYTYTGNDEQLNNKLKKGTGHIDEKIMDMVFQKAVLLYGVHSGIIPNIIHCQDATTALIPFFANKFTQFKNIYINTKFFITIHNGGPGYHHQLGTLEEASEYIGLPVSELYQGILNYQVEPFILSSFYSTMTTVSPWYAKELTDPDNKSSAGLSKAFFDLHIPIIGITNGIDFEKYDTTDTAKSCLPHSYSPENLELEGKYKNREDFLSYYSKKRAIPPSIDQTKEYIIQHGFLSPCENSVYFCYHGRVVHQKGTDIFLEAAKIALLKDPDLRFIITGQGNSDLENNHIQVAKEYPGQYLYLQGYERRTARLCVAVGDFMILPSLFEPCCLEDFIAQIFGTIPIAHAIGGLQKLIDNETGFLYKPNTPEVLADIILEKADDFRKNPDTYLNLISNSIGYIRKNYSWENIISTQYIPLYNKVLQAEKK
jgi:starch synthase